MHTLANSEVPDEIPHKAAFHQGLHCLLRQKHLQSKKYNFYFEIIPCESSIITMDYPKSIVPNQKEESNSAYKGKASFHLTWLKQMKGYHVNYVIIIT